MYDNRGINNQNNYRLFNQVINIKETNEKNNKRFLVNNEDLIYLKKKFNKIKLKVYISNIINIEGGKIGVLNKNIFTIYDNYKFEFLSKIEFEDKFNIISVIELDNKSKDLILAVSTPTSINIIYQILIYKFEDKKYSLFQRIVDNKKAFGDNNLNGLLIREKDYILQWIKKLSGNRFMVISNYGIKIYFLNENIHYIYYSCILINRHINNIKKIYEINKNELFLISKIKIEKSFRGKEHEEVLIEKLELKLEIKNESKNDLSSFYLKSSYKRLQEYTSNNIPKYNLSDIVILLKKYIVIMVGNELLIFNLLNELFMYKFNIIEDKLDNDSFFIGDFNCNILKWNCKEDNKFLILRNKRIIQCELNEVIYKDKKFKNLISIDIKITASNNLPCNKIIKTDNEKNLFYVKQKGYIIFF